MDFLAMMSCPPSSAPLKSSEALTDWPSGPMPTRISSIPFIQNSSPLPLSSLDTQDPWKSSTELLQQRWTDMMTWLMKPRSRMWRAEN